MTYLDKRKLSIKMLSSLLKKYTMYQGKSLKKKWNIEKFRGIYFNIYKLNATNIFFYPLTINR